jgi:1,4-dihydroxy-2-naphthoate octaprenyltransferase
VSFKCTNGTSLAGVNTRLDDVAIRSLFYSACIITSTIHCSDFPDVIGDLAQGRTTLPILCPKGSRAAFFFAISAWSWYLAPAWALGRLSSVCFIAFGIYVGWRVWACTSPRADKMSYVLYNVSVTCYAYICLPDHVSAVLALGGCPLAR